MIMFSLIAAPLFSLTAAQAQADLPALSLQQQTSLRCATAFAIVSELQANGGANELPPLQERGSEFFVRSLAQIMDETSATREQVQRMVQAQADTLDPQALEAIMPACLDLLDASGL